MPSFFYLLIKNKNISNTYYLNEEHNKSSILKPYLEGNDTCQTHKLKTLLLSSV